ncbi:hypothetical protein ABBQ38_006438 [Trebouxia sp. C0009 RCD-2024]
MVSTLLRATDTRSHKVAGFVVLFSVLLLVEGTTRVNLHVIPGGPWRGNHMIFPPIVALISAVGEMIFAFFGLCVGYFALAHGMANRLVVMVCLATQIVFGWFVFVVYVLAMPSFAAARTPAMPHLSASATKAVILMGLTGSIAVCAALQGGQFMFTNILLGYTTGKGKVQSTTLWRGRLYFFAFLVLLKGISEVVIGSIIKDHLGGGRLATPVVEPPFVITKAGLVIADGVWVTLVGLIGLAIAGHLDVLEDFTEMGSSPKPMIGAASSSASLEDRMNGLRGDAASVESTV